MHSRLTAPEVPDINCKAVLSVWPERQEFPLVPVHTQATRQWLLNSWDKHQIPKPFSTIVIRIAEPFYVSDWEQSTEGTAEVQRKFEKLMLENVQKTQTIINEISKK